MRVVIQRVKRASVTIDGRETGAIGKGLLVLLGVHQDDREPDVDFLVSKTIGLRIFPDDEGKMNRGLLEVGGALLIVSQFTLYGDARKGKRPSFVDAAPPPLAIPLYEKFLARARALGAPVATGEFGAMMDVELVNDGPVTIIIDSPKAMNSEQ
jgi:D-tyrosyl-tRNA(Tyr) deacylase